MDVPLGTRVERVLSIAYAARRPVLLEGETGIGKSAIVASAAAKLGVQLVVLDLSLLEPPDLVGVPIFEGGRTTHATPAALPMGGSGILLLEELNRAERYMQQPALQLLTARRLHMYELPPGWACFAAINPEDGNYQVTPLDPALRARFLTIRVHPHRPSFLAWARTAGVHDAVSSVIATHDRVFEDVSPRTWVYVSDVLSAIPPRDRADVQLARDLLGGYLPSAWVDVVLQSLTRRGGDFDFRVLDLLATYHSDAVLRRRMRSAIEKGKTDAVDEIAHRLRVALEGPTAGAMIEDGELVLESFERLLTALPGDVRELLQEALGQNSAATALLDIDAEAFVTGAAPGDDVELLASWARAPLLRHRVLLAVTALRAFAAAHGSVVRAGALQELASRLGPMGRELAPTERPYVAKVRT